MDRSTLLAYPDFNELFKIHTNTSKLQIGAVISHKSKLISLYSRRLTDTEKRYAVTVKDLLIIAKTLY